MVVLEAPVVGKRVHDVPRKRVRIEFSMVYDSVKTSLYMRELNQKLILTPKCNVLECGGSSLAHVHLEVSRK